MQYTLRNIPEEVDRALRERARREGRSLNEVAIRALAQALNFGDEPVRRRDLDDISGSWIDDPELEAALDDQRRIDPELW